MVEPKNLGTFPVRWSVRRELIPTLLDIFDETLPEVADALAEMAKHGRGPVYDDLYLSPEEAKEVWEVLRTLNFDIGALPSPEDA